MDNKEYIESGLLELYVAGALSEEEMIATTEMIRKHPEIKAAVEKAEEAFMAFSALHAPPISSAIKNNILNMAKQFAITSSPNTTGLGNKIVCGLGWLLFVGSLLLNLYQYNNHTEVQQQLEKIETENQIFADDLNKSQQQYELSKDQFEHIRLPDTKAIPLASAGIIPDVEAVVYWNPKTQKVYVDASKLPEPPPGKVYQLWWMESLDPLTPNDAGTLDNFTENELKFFAGKPTGASLAFAITLEPEGGNEAPTLSALYVFGQV